MKNNQSGEQANNQDTEAYTTKYSVAGMKEKVEKEEMEIKKRIVGTPDYIAPEIIKGICTSNPSLDWWSCGIIVYEFLVGITPFNDETVEKVFDNIVN